MQVRKPCFIVCARAKFQDEVSYPNKANYPNKVWREETEERNGIITYKKSKFRRCARASWAECAPDGLRTSG